MSYQVLARKWRPRFFAEMIGQDHVVRALTNALDQDRLHHAYLFSGTRGVGKTTVARIFAKSLNCEKGVSALPCGECSACVEVDEGRFIDLIEVDAASRTGVDDTRELMENVSYAPTRGRYKVYLIDEVHMFSKSSFNALLKTLEEPPPHVKFLLATTDPQKLLPTVLSRCLQFNLKRVPVDTIATQIAHILAAESLHAETSAVMRIARAADGSVRDALSLLDQAIAFSPGEIALEHVDAMLGGVSHERVYALLDAVSAGDAVAVFKQLAALDDYAPDYHALLSDLLALLHQIAVIQAVPDIVREAIADPERARRFAHALSAEDVQLYYQIALTGRRDMPHVPDERNALEMTLLRMIAFRPVTVAPPGELPSGAVPSGKGVSHQAPGLPHVETSSAIAETSTVAPAPALKAPPPMPPQPREQAPTPAPPAPAPVPTAAVIDNAPPPLLSGAPPEQSEAPLQATIKRFENWQAEDWSVICTHLGLQGMYAQLVAHCALSSVEGNQINLVLTEIHQHLNNEKMLARVRDALSKLIGKPVVLNVTIGSPASETPAQQLERKASEFKMQTQQAITNDPVVQDIQRRFDASIAVDSIEPKLSS